MINRYEKRKTKKFQWFLNRHTHNIKENYFNIFFLHSWVCLLKSLKWKSFFWRNFIYRRKWVFYGKWDLIPFTLPSVKSPSKHFYWSSVKFFIKGSGRFDVASLDSSFFWAFSINQKFYWFFQLFNWKVFEIEIFW